MALTKEETTDTLSRESAPFLDWIEGWLNERAPLDLQSYLQSNNIGPDRVAVISVDLINGFAYKGPLSSPRVAAIVEPAARLFQRAQELGVTNFVLAQENHSHNAPEFEQYGPHGISGTDEAATVDGLRDLPFSADFHLVLKNSIHPALGTDFEQWLEAHPQVDTFLAVGDCTDLCLYQTVMFLKLRGNAADRRVTVIVPQDCVQTYDLPIETAQRVGALPHDGDLLHAVFLYSMALNGALCVSRII